jgi:hypothetical protein
MKPGAVIFSIPDDDAAPGEARDFCRTRGLTVETARIVKRGGKVEVEIKAQCKLKVQS